MSTDAIRSRFGALGSYGGTPLEDSGGLRRPPDSRPLLAERSAELRMSAWAGAGPLTLAQGIQVGVAVAQAGVAAAQILEAAPANSPKGSSARAGEAGTGESDAPRRSRGAQARGGVPVALVDMLAMAPEAASTPRASGSDLQAWLDIATGRQALRAAQEMRDRAPAPTAAEQAPEEAMSREPEPADVPVGAREAAESAESPVRPRESAESRVRAVLDQARRSFGAALERLDAQLEPALAATVARLGGAEPSNVAGSVASHMRQEPDRAFATHTGSGLPGVLGLLRWDLTPLSEPLPETVPGRG